jgi:hypothetical protein
MNEHIRRGNEARAANDLETAETEFTLALADPDSTTRRIANRLEDLAPKLRCAKARPTDLRRIFSHEEQITPMTFCRRCSGSAVFVLSRDGGFITKNCTKCKKSNYAYETDFPIAECCGKQWKIGLIEKNYHYRCDECGRTLKIADYVPRWSDLFPVDPIIAPGDPGWDNWGRKEP